ncbi:DUF4397 domain-containing protein, partial [Candidatus Woesearchaeota archaeon]|nr:DUF4397 domain-containing protein [Candidatus Woesearchaeota archaeon]
MNKRIIIGIVLIGLIMLMPAASAIKSWAYPMAGFRVVHAVSDAHGATIYAQANNRPVQAVIENIQYKQATQYYDVKQGQRKIWIGPTEDSRVKMEKKINLR